MLSDDLTGTVDCVSLACGCKEPVPTMVCADGNVEILPRTKAREIVAVNLSSRTIPGKEAYQRTYDAAVKVRDYPDQLLMKKMDTGFRGNAGYEIEGIFDATGKRLCFIMDHIPMRKTFTLYGHQYAAGQILSKSAFSRDDKLKAPRESYIPAILQKQTDIPVGSVDIDAVKGTNLVEKVKEQIDAGKRILVFDAISEADGLKVISTLQPIYPDVLWAGSTGIVEALITYLYGPVTLDPRHTVHELCICFSGTAYEMTRDQIAFAEERVGLKVIDLDMDLVMGGKADQARAQGIDAFLAENKAGSNVLMRPRVTDGRFDQKAVASAIMDNLSACAGEICKTAKFDRILIVGGETSQAVFTRLGVNTLEMEQPPEIGAGEGIVADGSIKGKRFVLKGGSTGNTYSLLHMMGIWDQPDDPNRTEL